MLWNHRLEHEEKQGHEHSAQLENDISLYKNLLHSSHLRGGTQQLICLLFTIHLCYSNPNAEAALISNIYYNQTQTFRTLRCHHLLPKSTLGTSCGYVFPWVLNSRSHESRCMMLHTILYQSWALDPSDRVLRVFNKLMFSVSVKYRCWKHRAQDRKPSCLDLRMVLTLNNGIQRTKRGRQSQQFLSTYRGSTWESEGPSHTWLHMILGLLQPVGKPR